MASREMEKSGIRGDKITYLIMCFYEYSMRTGSDDNLYTLTNLCNKAKEFSAILQIDNFKPTKTWVNLFQEIFEASCEYFEGDRDTLQNADIMNFCMKNKQKFALKFAQMDNVTKLYRIPDDELRAEKIKYLVHCMYEYLRRARKLNKAVQLAGLENLEGVCIEFGIILEIEAFIPPPERTLMDIYSVSRNSDITFGLSLNLRDIVADCVCNLTAFNLKTRKFKIWLNNYVNNYTRNVLQQNGLNESIKLIRNEEDQVIDEIPETSAPILNMDMDEIGAVNDINNGVRKHRLLQIELKDSHKTINEPPQKKPKI